MKPLIRIPLHRIFFYLLLVMIPVQLGYHTWPVWSYVLGRRIDYLSPTLYFTDILIIGCLLAWTYELLQYPHLERRRVRLSRRSVFVTVGILVFAGCNIIMATVPTLALYGWLKITEYILLGAYIMNTKPPTALTVLLLTAAALWSSGLAIAQISLQRAVGGLWWWLGERTFSADTPGIARSVICLPGVFGCTLVMRPYATFPHPNVLAGFLTPVIVVLSVTRTQIMRYLSGIGISRTIRKLLERTVPAFLVLTLLMTFSRTAILSLGIVGLAYAVRAIWKQTRVRTRRVPDSFRSPVFPVAVLSLSLTIVALVALSADMVSSGESLRLRAALAAPTLIAVAESPLVGFGLGNFIPALAPFLPRLSVQVLQPVHSIYLLLLSETGFVGFLLFMFAVVLAMKRGISSHSPFIWPLLPMLLVGAADHYYLTLQQGQLILTVFLSFLFL